MDHRAARGGCARARLRSDPLEAGGALVPARLGTSRETVVAPTQEPLAAVLAANRRAVRARVEAACRAAGRPPAAVRVVAVTKSVGPEVAAALVRAGEGELGESRVDELERKAARLAALGLAPRWHLVGHLQRNKARRAVRVADEIHSVDSLELLESLRRLGAEEGRLPGLWLQVKLADEPTKGGLDPGELPAALAAAAGMPLQGLMTLGELLADEAARTARARELFERLARLARELPGDAFEGGRARLSMGMSGDLEQAVAAGADVVRVGSAFFEGLDASAEAAPGSRERAR